MNLFQNQIKTMLPPKIQAFFTPDTEEIRLRRNREIIFTEPNREILTSVIADKELMEAFLDKVTKSSLYTYFDNIREGFLTVEGGHRIGIAGTAVYQDERLSYVKDISSLNIRIAHEIKGAADKLFQLLQQNEKIPGILIISPPGCGKTTLLRDLTRQISNEIPGSKITVIDERSELAAVHMGEAQNDLGKRCDILSGYSKQDGISRAIRALSPTLIVVDEIGSKADEESLIQAKQAGITVIATVHGNENGDFQKNIRTLMEHHIFELFVYLSKTNPVDRIAKIVRQPE